MAEKKGKNIVFLCFLGFLLILAREGFSAPLPKLTQEMLKKLKLDPSILAGIDKELEVPKDWIEKARKEGKLRVVTTPITPQQSRLLISLFKERYPFIAIEILGASQRGRVVKTLMAYKGGRVLWDVVNSIGGELKGYMEADALEDLSSIPNVKNLLPGAKDPNGLWAGLSEIYWCIGYNKRLVQKRDLPKKWEDILTNRKWYGGNLGLVNLPQLWVTSLWKAKGEHWTKNFLTRLFTEVKPQLRKEGATGSLALAAAGEFHAVIPSNQKRTYELASRGAPVGFTCPEPVPVSVGSAVLLKRSANPYAAKLFLNWVLSKEGQIAQYAAWYATPVHKDLRRPEFYPYADEILGKEVSFRDPSFELQVFPTLREFWTNLWFAER